MKKLRIVGIMLCACLCGTMAGRARQSQTAQTTVQAPESDSKMKYVYSLEEARRLSYQQKKPIFVNCYAAWAGPCKAMDKFVFSDAEFCKFMDKKFVNLWVDSKQKEGKEIAKEYNVKSFATYLVLDYKGQLLQRISGGGKLPDFKEKVSIALSPKTSQAGTRDKYESGKYSQKDLYNYLIALKVAGEDSIFRKVGKEYMATITPEEYPEKKNWIINYINKDRSGEYYRYLIAHKTQFVKNIGEEPVDRYIESILCPEVLHYATGDADYDAAQLDQLQQAIADAQLADTCATNIVYRIARLRGERKYHELLQYMEQEGKYLDKYHGARSNIELTFNFPDMKKEEREEVIGYLQKAVTRETGTRAKRLTRFIAELQKGDEGIVFTHKSFANVLSQAKAEKKLVFVDCYTSWCGPCRAMASSIFPRKEVGAYFNAHFVSTKIDMEKGEGVELAKKYGVRAFPTLLFLDAEGNVVKKAVGYKNAEQLLNLAKEAQ